MLPLSIFSVAFIPKRRLRGVSVNYDTNYEYQLRNVLKAFNFKPIDVYVEDFKDLNIQSTVQHFIDCALNSYR